jgi:hypothetical protein
MDFDAAAEALAAANSPEVAPSADVSNEQAPAQSQDSTSTVEAGTNLNEESFTNIDLNSLPPEVQAIAKSLQADYTRKTQEIAPLRKLGVDADVAAQAVEFVSRLEDPDFQRQIYDRLAPQFGSTDKGDEFDFDLDPADQGDPRDQQIQALTQRLEAFEQSIIEKEVHADLDRQDAIVRSSNPDFNDEDMRSVALHALNYQGDLVKGAEAYKAEMQRVLSRHIATKESVPATGLLPSSGHADVPADVPRTEKDIHNAALRMYLAEQSS